MHLKGVLNAHLEKMAHIHRPRLLHSIDRDDLPSSSVSTSLVYLVFSWYNSSLGMCEATCKASRLSLHGKASSYGHH